MCICYLKAESRNCLHFIKLFRILVHAIYKKNEEREREKWSAENSESFDDRNEWFITTLRFLLRRIKTMIGFKGKQSGKCSMNFIVECFSDLAFTSFCDFTTNRVHLSIFQHPIFQYPIFHRPISRLSIPPL